MAEPGLRTPPVGPGPSAGRARGLGTGSPPLVPTPPQHSLCPLPQARPDPAAHSNLAAQRRPHPQLLPERWKRDGPGMGGGVRGVPAVAPNPCPPGVAAAGRVLQPRMGRSAGLGSWLSRTTRLPSGTGGGPRRGNPIPQHRPRSKPAPNFPSGVGERGAAPGPGEDPGRGPDRMRDPVSLAPVPQPVPASRPPGCGQCSPRTEPPRGAQEGSRTISCPPLPLLAPSDPAPRACGGPCASRGTKRRLPGAQRLPLRVALASLTSSSPPESLDAALAFGSDPGPPPPARARLLSGRGATSPRSRLG